MGLVAGRIKDRLHRPVIAFARAEDGSLRGSARSVAGINIRDALDSDRRAPSRAHREIRRPRDGRRDDAARGEASRDFAPPLPAKSPRAPIVDALSGIIYYRRRAVRRRAVARDGARAARRRSLGPGISRAGLRRRIPHRRTHASSAAGTSSCSFAAAVRRLRPPSMPLPSATSAERSNTPRSERAPMCISPTGWRLTNTMARSACNSIVSTCSPRAPPSNPGESGVLRIGAHGNQSTQTFHQRSRRAHRLFEEVSLITTTSTSGCRK